MIKDVCGALVLGKRAYQSNEKESSHGRTLPPPFLYGQATDKQSSFWGRNAKKARHYCVFIRNCANHFTYIIKFDISNSLWGRSYCCRWRNWGSESLSDLLNVTQPGYEEAGLSPHGPVPEVQTLATTWHLKEFGLAQTWSTPSTPWTLESMLIPAQMFQFSKALSNIQIHSLILHPKLYFHTQVLQFYPISFLPLRLVGNTIFSLFAHFLLLPTLELSRNFWPYQDNQPSLCC